MYRGDFEEIKLAALDKVARGLAESCIVPITRRIDRPSINSTAIRQEIQTRNSDGDQILATVGQDIVKFQNIATVYLKDGHGEIQRMKGSLRREGY